MEVKKNIIRFTLGDHLSLLAMYDKCVYYNRIQIYISAIYITYTIQGVL